jgi:hypothetical protein
VVPDTPVGNPPAGWQVGVACDSTFMTFVEICHELREFCGFKSVPDAGKVTTFKQVFVEYIAMVFEKLVDATEPIPASRQAGVSS